MPTNNVVRVFRSAHHGRKDEAKLPSRKQRTELLALLALVLLSSCTARSDTSVTLDLRPVGFASTEVDTLEIRVGSQAGNLRVARTASMPPALPWTYTVSAENPASPGRLHAELRLRFSRDPSWLVYSLEADFVAGEHRRIEVVLDARCRRSSEQNPCGPGSTCSAGGVCVSSLHPPQSVPVPDAGIDAERDAGSDDRGADVLMFDSTNLDAFSETSVQDAATDEGASDSAPAPTEGSVCLSPRILCAGTCIDPMIDLNNCGMCDRVCAVPNGTPACTNGRCSAAACNPGFGDCDSVAANGCETNTQNTPAHCGGCGMACPARPNATTLCLGGRCVLQCMPGTADCNNTASDGCEVDTNTSSMHCGRCGNLCTAGANATVTCTAGTCRSVCIAGFDDCNGLAADGCEASLNSVANCGRCGNTCTGSAAFCSAGTGGTFSCTSACTGTQMRCGSSCVDTMSNVDNCGSCGNVCPTPTNGTRTCSAGRCGITCNAGFENCDGNAANGCEARPELDPLNCGACGRVCGMVPNGASTCRSGQCTIVLCSPQFGNCDGVFGNGCEVNVSSNLSHCGGCGIACSSNNVPMPVCSNGMCVGTCAPNTANCDGNALNGCEANTTTDPQNCGSCGRTCASNVCGTTIRATMATMPTDWVFNGNASYSAANQSAMLTNMATNQAGTIWYRNPITGNVFDVSFEFRMGFGGGTRGEGLAFALQRNGNTALGRTGSGLGVAGLMGLGVEFDSSNNNDCGDSNGSHTSVISLTTCNAAGQPQTLSGGADLGFDIANNTWHTALVRFGNGFVTVQINGTTRINSAPISGFNPTDTFWFGFGAGTGSSSHRHEVRNITITFPSTRCL